MSCVCTRGIWQGSVNEYSFDAVFPPEARQAEVYEGTAKPHIAELLEGINVTVFAYGATGDPLCVCCLTVLLATQRAQRKARVVVGWGFCATIRTRCPRSNQKGGSLFRQGVVKNTIPAAGTCYTPSPFCFCCCCCCCLG